MTDSKREISPNEEWDHDQPSFWQDRWELKCFLTDFDDTNDSFRPNRRSVFHFEPLKASLMVYRFSQRQPEKFLGINLQNQKIQDQRTVIWIYFSTFAEYFLQSLHFHLVNAWWVREFRTGSENDRRIE